MATQLVVRYGGTTHRFVKNTQVQVTAAGAVQKELAGSKLGEHHFDVSASLVGSTIEVLVRIPSPSGLAATLPFLMDVKQNVEVMRLASGVISLRAHPSSPGNRFTGAYHPRLEGHLANSGPGHLYYLDVDNTFLHVTPLAAVTNPKFIAPYVSAVPLPTPPAGAPPHAGAKLFLYEYTRGRPSLWAVDVPPAIKPETKTVHAVLFLRPIGDANVPYTNVDDASPTSLMRYLLDPVFGPFFVVTIKGAKKFAQTQNAGFERQVAQANKPVIFVTPNHHASDYGDAANATWPKALQSLKTALWAENHIGGTVANGLDLGKKALGGFSFGGVPVFAALNAHPKLVDELYLFDAKGFDGPTVQKWFALGGKRLRMVGGGFEHKAMLDLEKALNTSAATTRPDTLDAWGTDPLYTSATFMVPLTDSSVASAPAGSLSARTGLFLTSRLGNIGFELQARSAAGTVIVPSVKVPNLGVEEFSANLANYTECFADPACNTALVKEFLKLKTTPPVVPVGTAAGVNALIAAMVSRVQKTRHQWTVVGGRDSTGASDRGVSFSGFLQAAIQAGNFP